MVKGNNQHTGKKSRSIRIHLAIPASSSILLTNLLLSLLLVSLNYVLIITVGFTTSALFNEFYLSPKLSDYSAIILFSFYVLPVLLFPCWIFLHFRVFEYLLTKKTISFNLKEVHTGEKAKKDFRRYLIILLLSYTYLLEFFIPRYLIMELFNKLGGLP